MEPKIFVVQGIKIENEDPIYDKFNLKKEIKEELGSDVEKFWPEEKINCNGNYHDSCSDRKCQIIKDNDAKLADRDDTNATKITAENIEPTGYKSLGNDANYLLDECKINQNSSKKCSNDEDEISQTTCIESDSPSNFRKIYEAYLKSYQCNTCECSFDSKYQLEKHAVFIHGKEKPFKCEECDKTFIQKSSITSHITAVHRKFKPFNCTKCDYSCSQKGALAVHIKTVHLTLKPFKCTECEYSCSRKEGLTRHNISVHTQLKPFKCAECDYSCGVKGDLAGHIMSVHRKLKPFKCTVCDFSCSRKGALTVHIRSVHLKFKPFKCKECNYSCCLKEGLIRHIICVHKK